MKQFTKIFTLIMLLMLLPISAFTTSTISVEAGSSDSGAISKPKNIKAMRKGDTSIKVSWKKVKGATEYIVYRSTGKYGSYKKVKTVNSNKSSYTNSSLKRNKRYYYKVKAVKKAGSKTYKSPYSSYASAKTSSTISAETAKQIALNKTGGGYVKKCKLDYEHGVRVYEIDIIKDGIEYEIDVRVSDGKIVKFKIDYDD